MLKRRAILLTGCALAAVGMGIARPANAQAYNATPGTQAGSVTYNRANPLGAGTETITINSPSAVILWSPNAGDFLPAGNLAMYQGAAGNPDYTVLNRIVPAGAPLASIFNGTVQSRVSATDNTVSGNIYFYNPSGIIAGPTSVFNVGSLVLTTLDVTFDAAGNLGSPVLFNGVAGSKAAVNIQSGAQINATGSNAYVALVSPSITQAGTVSANGSIAYIAGESVDLTINAGLLDFTINTGTTDTNGIIHTGTTTGPASTSSSDTQVIAMVALPKNAALTMLLTGTIGYTPAASAANEGSSVILAAGYDNPVPNVVPANRFGRILLGLGGTIRNSMTAYATDTVTIDPSLNTFTFENDALIYAVNMIDLTVGAASSAIDAKGNLTLRAGEPGIGGTVNITATDSGQILVNGPFLVNATSDAADFDTVTSYLDGFGGAVNITADSGLIRSSTFTQFDVSGFGQFGGSLGGDGQGGSINALVVTDGVIETPELTLIAHGFGGGSDSTGGNGFGGDILVTDSGGQYDLGILRAFASGYGGGASLGGGDGNSGSVDILITGQTQDWDQLFAVASAEAGLSFGGGPAGLALVNRAAIDLSVGATGALNVSDVISLTSNAYSGYDRLGGYDGRGGGISVQVTDGGSLTADKIEIEANADFAGDLPSTGDTTPNQYGGTIDVRADNGTITARLFTATADAYNHPALRTAGTTDGGTVQVSALIGGTINIGDPVLGTPGDLSLSASAFGAPGPSTAVSTGGMARLLALDGTIQINGSAAVVANASHAQFDSVPDGDGTDAFGGTASVELLSEALGNSVISATSLTVQANGDARLQLTGGSGAAGGDPIVGNGGNGVGGSASVTVDPGTFTVGGLNIESIGRGGTASFIDSLVQFQSGDGVGGTSTFFQYGGTSTIGTMALTTTGFGGGGAPAASGTNTAGTAGEGIGGISRLVIGGGSLGATSADLDASATGGNGTSHTGSGDATDGGDGNGGLAVFEALGGGSFTTGSLTLKANGIGGVGGTAATGLNGNGGNGFAQSATVDLADGDFSLGDVRIEANGTGGDSGDAGSGLLGGADGGQGFGGLARFNLTDSVGPIGPRSMASLYMDASGFGGFGSQQIAQATVGDADLVVSVFDAASALTVPGSLSVFASGFDLSPSSGIDVTISGAPLDVGGDLTLSSGGPVVVTANEALRSGGQVGISGLTFTSTGLIESAMSMFVEGVFGINADRLSSGGNASLTADRGPGDIVVADLNALSDADASGRSINIHSSGALQFAFADASGGDVFIETVGDLGVAQSFATGSVSLTSTTGGVSGGDLTGGTWVYVDGATSAGASTITAVDDVGVTARNGNLTVGDVTAGDEIWLSIFGTNATRVLTAGNLVSTGLGDDTAAGPPVLFGGPGPTGNVVRVRSSGSVALGTVQTPGRAILVADLGTLSAGAVTAPEAAIVLARGDIGLGSVTTTGDFYVADSSMFGVLPPNYDPATITGLAPVRTAGGLTITGAVSAANITIGVGGTASAPSWNTPGRLLVDAGGAFNSPGTTTVGGIVSITADGGIGLNGLISGGTTLLRAINGAVNVTSLTSPGAVTALGGSVNIGSPGALAFADLDATAGAASVQTAGNLSLTTVDATGAVTLTSTGGTVVATGAVNAGGAAAVSGADGVTLPTLVSGGTTLLAASNGAVNVASLTSAGAVTAQGSSVSVVSPGTLTFADLDATAGPATIQTAGNLGLNTGDVTGALTLNSIGGVITATGAVNAGGAVSATAPNGVTFAALSSGGTTLLRAINGPVVATALTSTGAVTAFGRSVDITSPGALTFADLDATAGNARVVTGGNLTLTTADATGSLTFDANGTLTMSGVGRAATITATSNDIVLPAGSALGVRGVTTSLTVTNRNPARTTFVGGAANATGYSLDQAELQRLFADNTILLGTALAGALPAGQGTVVIDDFALGYGANRNIGTGGTLEISTQGRISVIGDVALTTTGATDTFELDPSLIELDTSLGSIAMLDAGGNPLGRLNMIGNTVAVATTALLPQLSPLADFTAINALLNQPGGNPLALRAGTMNFNVTGALYIQNSGATALYRDRQGFTANGVNITTTGSASTRIAINGQILTAGGPVTGLNTQSLVTINGAAAAAGGQFDAASTINGCIIGGLCAPPPGSNPPSDSELTGPIPDSPGPGALFAAPLVELAGTDPLIAPPLVDEPITGVGNDDLWQPACDDDNDNAACPKEDGDR